MCLHIDSQVFSVKFLLEKFTLLLGLLVDYTNKLMVIPLNSFVDFIGKKVHQCDNYHRKMIFCDL